MWLLAAVASFICNLFSFLLYFLLHIYCLVFEFCRKHLVFEFCCKHLVFEFCRKHLDFMLLSFLSMCIRRTWQWHNTWL